MSSNAVEDDANDEEKRSDENNDDGGDGARSICDANRARPPPANGRCATNDTFAFSLAVKPESAEAMTTRDGNSGSTEYHSVSIGRALSNPSNGDDNKSRVFASKHNVRTFSSRYALTSLS